MVENDVSDTEWDFRSKYVDRSAVARWLIDEFYRDLARLVRPVAAEHVLEVGCGEGFSTERIRGMLPDSVRLRASDVEQRLVDVAAKRNPTVQVTRESIYDLPHGDDAFDLVVCLEVLEHLTDPGRALRELMRVSRRWVAVSVPCEPLWRVLNMMRFRFWRDLGNTPGHLQHWSRAAFVSFVREHGDPVVVRSPIPWTQVLVRKRVGSAS